MIGFPTPACLGHEEAEWSQAHERLGWLGTHRVPRAQKLKHKSSILRMSEQGGVEFKGGGLHDSLAVLTVLAVLESTLRSFSLSYKIQYQEAAVTVLTVSAVGGVVAILVVTDSPLKLILIFGALKHLEHQQHNRNYIHTQKCLRTNYIYMCVCVCI